MQAAKKYIKHEAIFLLNSIELFTISEVKPVADVTRPPISKFVKSVPDKNGIDIKNSLKLSRYLGKAVMKAIICSLPVIIIGMRNIIQARNVPHKTNPEASGRLIFVLEHHLSTTGLKEQAITMMQRIILRYL